MKELPQLEVKSRAAWRAWLRKNHGASQGVWAVLWRKGTTRTHVSLADISEEAIAFGWIDSRVGQVDAQRSRLLVTPRSPKSAWSRVSKARAAKMEQLGLMTPAGRAAIDAAKRSGGWTALDAVEELSIPPDLARALRAQPPARKLFDAFPRSAKRAILEWIASAKQPETRARRIAETASQAAKNLRANQWRQPASAHRSRRDATSAHAR